MDYEASVEWLFNQFPAYQKIGVSAYKPDLDNVLYLCEFFQVDYKSLKYIHIAGTNGKGSTSNFLASILHEANFKTGLFTSPHILDFRERIRVNGVEISEEKVIAFCEAIRHTPMQVKPSFFEITWVLALQYFIDEACEICVIETGLGGRLDATNIISPILSIITNISLDHTSILGTTIPEIAFEKAGIIKANTPVVIGSYHVESFPVFEKTAAERSAPLHLVAPTKTENLFFPRSSYLAKNEQTVRKAIEVLNKLDFSISEKQIRSGLERLAQNTGFKGRFQQISVQPRIILDAAHNAAGIQELMQSIAAFSYEKLYLIYGASNDKDISEILNLFPGDAHVMLTVFTNARSLNLDELNELLAQSPFSGEIFSSVEQAFLESQKLANENDMILVTGSFFLLSDFFSFFSPNNL